MRETVARFEGTPNLPDSKTKAPPERWAFEMPGVRVELRSCFLLAAAVSAPITEINDHADNQPYSQAYPGQPGEVVHQVHRDQHSHNWDKRHPRRLKRAHDLRAAAP